MFLIVKMESVISKVLTCKKLEVLTCYFSSLVVQMVKRLPTMRETWVRSLGWEDSLEKEMPTHSSIPAWEIPWTEDPGSYSPWGHKESDTTEYMTPLLSHHLHDTSGRSG